MTSWRGWTDFSLGRVQAVGVSVGQVRACTQHDSHRDASHVDLDNSYNVRMNNAVIFTAHTYPSGW